MEEMVGTAAAEDCRVPHLPPPDQLAGAGGEEKGLPPADHRPLVAAVRTKTDFLILYCISTCLQTCPPSHTLSLVSMSFSGFIGVLLAIYHKAASLGAAFSYAKVSVYLLLGGGIAGALALLLRRLLSSNGGGDRQSGAWQRAILAAANAAMTAMLVPAVLMIAETILHRLLVGAAFPVVAGAAAWLLIEFCTAEGGGGTETEDGKTAQGSTMYAVAMAVASVSFGAILAIFGGMLGGGVGKEQLKACTFLLASAFVAAVSLGVVVLSGMARPEKTKASTAFAATVLTCCGIGTLVLAALALFYQIGA